MLRPIFPFTSGTVVNEHLLKRLFEKSLFLKPYEYLSDINTVVRVRCSLLFISLFYAQMMESTAEVNFSKRYPYLRDVVEEDKKYLCFVQPTYFR